MRFTVADDSGFLAVVDPDGYQGFVGDERGLGRPAWSDPTDA